MTRYRFVVKGRRGVPMDELDPGPLVYRNDAEEGPSRRIRKRTVRFQVMLEVIIYPTIIILLLTFPPGPWVTILAAILVFAVVATFVRGYLELRRIDESDFLPRVHEKGVVFSYVTYIDHIVMLVPYEQLADVQRRGANVRLLTRGGAKFSFRYRELGDEGFSVLTDMLARHRAWEYPVAGGLPAQS